ncbi:hypothetical protein [Brevibacterium yomogidense]|uniref:hypothetical protein n=1 Tax=Brevibacterium yomogidense TaxID=946573 RepID=UPI0018DF6F3E|nr:hypothetical protein [Brevibacterium yomogidense]
MSPDVLTVCAALGIGIAAALLGWPLTRLTLHVAAGRDRARREEAAAPDDTDAEVPGRTGDTSHEDDPDPDTAVHDVDDDGLLRGGLWIGLLERAFVAGGIALGEPSILAVVVAIKGLGRVPELLKSPTAGERFIIGSLASLGVALGVGVVGRALIG